MRQSFLFILPLYTATTLGAIVPRGDGSGPPNPGMSTLPDPGLQDVPDEPKAANTFNNGQPQNNNGMEWGSGSIPDLYQPREIDIPFGRMFHGKMSFFDYGEYNDPKDNTATWSPNVYDNANQSACGIPDDAYFQTKAAIHPYFLKYAGLDRYCMQDVCISFWPEGDTPSTSTFPDMIAKVTDICSTDPNDPTYCASPSDVKLDRAKVQVMYSIPSPGKDDAALQSPVYPKGAFWHLTKCWTNGLPQPAYQDNWFGQPQLPNNFMWGVDATRQQWKNNQNSYPSKGWDTYQDGLEIPTPEAIAAVTPPGDWVPGQEPKWAPIAGGKGFGTPERSQGPPPVLWPGKSTALAGGGGGSGDMGVGGSVTAGGNGSTGGNGTAGRYLGASNATARTWTNMTATTWTNSTTKGCKLLLAEEVCVIDVLFLFRDIVGRCVYFMLFTAEQCLEGGESEI
ncbi:MAG: hypothetical protein Q9170_002694 [Blastenia crenularia]